MKISCPKCQTDNKIKLSRFGIESENCETCGTYLWDKTKQSPHIAFVVMNLILMMGAIHTADWLKALGIQTVMVHALTITAYIIFGLISYACIVKICIYKYLKRRK